MYLHTIIPHCAGLRNKFHFFICVAVCVLRFYNQCTGTILWKSSKFFVTKLRDIRLTNEITEEEVMIRGESGV